MIHTTLKSIYLYEVGISWLHSFVLSFFLTDNEEKTVSKIARHLQQCYYTGSYYTTQLKGGVCELCIALIGQLFIVGVLIEGGSISTLTFGSVFGIFLTTLVLIRGPFALMAHHTLVRGHAKWLILLSRSKSLRKGHLNVRLATLAYWGSLAALKLYLLHFCVAKGLFENTWFAELSDITLMIFIPYYFVSFFFGSVIVIKFNDLKYNS